MRQYAAAAAMAAATLAGGCMGDYGDAPDGAATGYPPAFTQTGAFPTLLSSGGAVALDVDDVVLGAGASAEDDANDPGDPDGVPNLAPANTDSDDGIVDFVLVLVSIPPPAAAAFQVSAPAGSPGGTYFLNALIDLNMDGQWGGTVAPGLVEWAIVNFPFSVASGGTATVTPPPFLYGFGNRLPDPAWMRVAVTSAPIADSDWDGGGIFDSGEIEDHLIVLPMINNKQVPIVDMDCPARVNFRGAPAVPFVCSVTNLRAVGGNFGYSLSRLNGDVLVTDPRDGGPAALVGTNGAPPAPPQAIAPLQAVALPFTATRGNQLPSLWQYSAWTIDPPAIVSQTGVTAGFGASTGTIEFVDEPEEEIPQ